MQNDEQEIRALVRTWLDASKAGDMETVLSLMSEDVVFLIAGREPMIGRAAFAAASQVPVGAPAPLIEGNSEIQELQVHGDWAYMWTELSVSIHMPGEEKTLRRAGHTLSVLKKENGKWLLARDANMLTTLAE
jgi:uncharacterized protein (TIGR02246 family)